MAAEGGAGEGFVEGLGEVTGVDVFEGTVAEYSEKQVQEGSHQYF